jgi:Tfp pilus assembly protein PilZ
MKVIQSNIRDEKALQERFLPEMQNCGIFIPKAQGLTVGEQVCVWIQLQSHSIDLHLYGTVFWMRHRGDGRHAHLRTGAGIGFRAGQEERVELLHSVLDGSARPVPKRRDKRTPLLSPWRCEIRSKGDEGFRPAMIADISKGGASCVVGTFPPDEGDRLELHFPWHSEVIHELRLVWRKTSESRFRLGLVRRRGSTQSDRQWNDLVSRARRLFRSSIWTRTSTPPSRRV